MAAEPRLVFLDLETAGADPDRHPVIQMAAIAVDSSLNEVESIEVKIRFDESLANPKSLNRPSYCPAIWNRTALEPQKAARLFSNFLRRHATVELQSKSGEPYRVAQLVAHNAERFDGPFLHAWYRRQEAFCPARYITLCTKQRALWLFDEFCDLHPPPDFKLVTLCEYFAVPILGEGSHDAMSDVRATVGLYRAMRKQALAGRRQAA